MEISQAPLPVQVESQMQRRYRKQLTVIKASKFSETEQVNKIKMLQHVTSLSIFRRNKHLLGIIVGDQNFLRSIAVFSNLSVDVTNEIYSQSYTTQTTQRTLIESTRFLYSIQRILTPKENYALSQYIESRINDNSASVPRPVSEATNEELEQCFSSLGIDYKQASLTAIKEAIQSIIPSKQDIEITAQVIEKEIQRHDIDYKFPVFSEDNYFQEFFTIINREDFPKDAITQLNFSNEPIKVVPNIVGEFKYIQLLDFSGCISLTTLPNLSGNKKLWSLCFNGCTNLETSPDLSGNPALKKLSFFACKSFTRPPNLNNNKLLTELNFCDCTRLQRPPDLSHNPALTNLWFSRCTSLETPPDLRNNQALIWLSFNGCTSLTTIPDLRNKQALTYLSCEWCTSLETPPDLSRNTRLFSLSFVGCINLQTPPDLRNNPILTHLSFFGCARFKMPPDLSTLTQLRTLDVRGVFPENLELSIDVFENLEAAQALIRAIEIYRFASQVIDLDEEELSGFVSSSDEDSDEAQVQFSALPEVEETQERKSRCRFNSGCHIL